jgi:hypothetical protein
MAEYNTCYDKALYASSQVDKAVGVTLGWFPKGRTVNRLSAKINLVANLQLQQVLTSRDSTWLNYE